MKKIGFFALFMAFLLAFTCVYAGEANDPIVIKAGDCTVTLSQAQAYYDNLYAQYNGYYTNYGQNMPAEELIEIRNHTINELSLYALLDNKIAEYGLADITDAQRQALQEESNALFMENAQLSAQDVGITVEEMIQELAYAGVTPELQLENMLEMLPYTRLYDYVTRNVTVDDNMIQRAYDTYVQQDKEKYANDITQYELSASFANTNVMYRPEGYRAVNHILLSIPDQLAVSMQDIQADLLGLMDEIDALNEALKSPESHDTTTDQINANIAQKQQEYDLLNVDFQSMKEEIMPNLQGVLNEINEKLLAGESFGAIMLSYGRDEAIPLQEDGYCYVHKQSILFDETFRDAAMSLSNIGDLSAPIITDHGIYIIQYVKDIKGGAVAINDEITETLRNSLLEDAKYAYYNEIVMQWQQQISIEAHPELIQMPDANAIPMESAPEGTISNPAEADGSIG